MIQCICRNCNTEFSVYNYRKNTAKFCSLKCASIFKNGKNHPAWKGGILVSMEKRKQYLKSYNKLNWFKNKERYSAEKKIYYINNKDKLSTYRKKRYIKNRDIILIRVKKYSIKNKEKIQKYKKEKYKSDGYYRMKHVMRTHLYLIHKTKGKKKNTKTEKLLGVSFDIAKKHIERQFSKGMSWNNYGKWHIDHIIPFSSAKTEEELKLLCHYKNLQPLWAIDNYKKKDKIPQVQLSIPI